MRDIRDALVALTQSAGEVGDSLTFGCDCEGCTKTATGLADAILAEFDVTPRGEGMTIQIGGRRAGKTQDLAERVADEVMKRGGSATVISLPSVEDVARALWELDEQEAETTGGALGLPWSALDSLTQGTYRADAEDLLALLPGRAEAEVKAEGWDEGLRAGEAFERARWQWSAGATARVVNGLAERPERPANPYRAAVRPSGQEGS